MIILKLLFHISAILKKFNYKIIFGAKFKIGSKSTFRRHFYIMIEENGNVNIGKNCFFNNDCSLSSMIGITIGDNTIFGEGVKLYDHNHKFRDSTKTIKEQGYSYGKITIGNDCWIGSNVVILKGVTIGNNCVIGSGAVIKEDISDNMIVKTNSNYELVARVER